MKRISKYHAQWRHALHYLQVLKTADDLYCAGHEKVTQGLARFELESSNITMGQAWAENGGDGDEEVARLCVFPMQIADWRSYPCAYIQAKTLNGLRKRSNGPIN